jgi:hypothetical protein
MVVPNYMYLKLKIPDPKGIITVGTTYQCTFECEAECFQFAEALIRSERLHAEPAKDVKDAAVSDNDSMLRIGMTLDPK